MHSEDGMHSKSSILAQGGMGAVLTYMVRFEEPGKYYVWVRALAMDGDDNTLHIGIDNQWPESGKKLTFQGKKWNWSNTQRDTKAQIAIDVATKGNHEIHVSMRENGCELDRIFLCDKADYAPVGQGIKAGSGSLKYDFQIVEPGNYPVLLQGRIKDPSNRPDTLDPYGNDIWLKLTGGKNIDGKAGLKDDWNKVAILGHPVGFSWNTNIDVDKAHPINPICRSFDRGTYSIELSGRSQGYAIDRVMILKHEKEPIVDFDASKRTLDSQTVSTRQGSWETRCYTAICTAHRKFYRARV